MTTKFAMNFALRSGASVFDGPWKWTRVMKAAGAIYRASSDGSAKDTTGVASADKWGGNADPLLDTVVTGLDTVVAWWCASLPSTIKLSMTSNVTGTFIRGEKVTQATSGAEGELVGYDFDTVNNNAGHAVIIPRTGTFDSSHVVTGAVSGATFTATAFEEFTAEIVITKANNLTQGSIYLQRVSVQNENASRFSVLATAAGCTASVAPGGGGTGNAFPSAGSYVRLGTQTGTPAHANWWPNVSGLGKCQISAVNMTGATGVSPDGTTWIVQGDPVTGTQLQMMGYFRCDGTEAGDVDPFISFGTTATAYNNANVRLTATVGLSPDATNSGHFWQGAQDSSNSPWRGSRRRGWATADTFAVFCTGQFWCQSNFGGTNGFILGSVGSATPATVAASYTTQRVRDPFKLVNSDPSLPVHKGFPRWLQAIQGNTPLDTFNGSTGMILIHSGITSGVNAGIMIGPIDGTTVPAQA